MSHRTEPISGSSFPASSLVFIAGTGRSGTTWLAELLNYDSSARLIFEPFHRDNVKEWANFSYAQYFRPEQEAPEAFEAAGRILRGQISNPWIDSAGACPQNSSRIILKEIRANLMLGWLRRNFPGFPLIYIIRNPFAVALSSQKAGWNYDLQGVFLSQPDLVEDFLSPFIQVIKDAGSSFEQFITLWCIEQTVALKHLNGLPNCQVLAYENLVLHTEEQLKKVFELTGRPFSPQVMTRAARPAWSGVTSQSPHKSSIRKGIFSRYPAPISAWEKALTSAQHLRAQEIIQTFGLSSLYGAGMLPKMESFPS